MTTEEQNHFVSRGNNPAVVSFTSPVNNMTSAALISTVFDMVRQGHDDIHIFLSSPGGSVSDGITIYNTLSALDVPISTYNTGTVDSIANVLFQMGTRRIAFPTSRFMFHGVGFDIQAARFELKDLRERMGGIENDQGMIGDILVRHTNLSSEDVATLFLEAAFVGSMDAKDRGIVDEIGYVSLPNGIPIAQLVFQG